MESKCTICKKDLNVPSDPMSIDCGGDCLECMAIVGDPSALMAWIEAKVTLHTNVTFCYVVDAYQVMYIVRDDEVAVSAEGERLDDALQDLVAKVREYVKTIN